MHDREPGFHQVCSICGWEDDLSQLRFPLMPGSSNRVSLHEAQQNFRRFGASERRTVGRVRRPEVGEAPERGWRPLDLERDNVERPCRGVDYADSYPWPDTTVLYYWRSTYWRRLAS